MKKTKWNCRTLREQLLILWILMGVVWCIDMLNTRLLCMQYHCDVKELLWVVKFDCLSVVFAIVDLILGIVIWKKTVGNVHIVINHIRFDLFEIAIPTIYSGWGLLLSKMLSALIIIISILSLILDVLKFFI